jgi:methionine synthase II (cobalamin-independent)
MRDIDEASKYVAVEQLAVTPHCGFGTVAILRSLDEETQWRKLALVGAVADRVWSR